MIFYNKSTEMLTVTETHHKRVGVLCLPAMGRPGQSGQDSIKRVRRGGRVPAVMSSRLHPPEPTEPEPEPEPELSCNIAMRGREEGTAAQCPLTGAH